MITMRYVNQLNYPHMLYRTRTDPEHPRHETGKRTTVRASGCGLCSAIMVADRLLPSYKFDLEDALELAYSCNASHGVGTDYKLFAPAFAEKMGLKFVSTSDQEQLLHCLRTGGAAVVHVGCGEDGQPGLFTRVGHYMAVIGEEPDGRLAILDPSYYVGKYEEEGRSGKVEVVKEFIALCTPEILHAEGRTGKPFYHLFWRA